MPFKCKFSIGESSPNQASMEGFAVPIAFMAASREAVHPKSPVIREFTPSRGFTVVG